MATLLHPRVSEASLTVQSRWVLLASANPATRASLRSTLGDLRWHVREVGGAAEALAELEIRLPEALILDLWLPDIEANEFARLVQATYPAIDVLRVDGHIFSKETRSVRRPELLLALHTAEQEHRRETPMAEESPTAKLSETAARASHTSSHRITRLDGRLPGLIGESPCMLELGQLIQLVAPRHTTVLIEGPTGSGKELVAQAVHLLSLRADRPLVVLNCAAIPETLLEAELFGHARGAFTGAVQSRIGRIEAADGGTLFLDEIGEMPLALQAKMLRFLEGGEIQRVGDNVVSHVDVRVVAATHQPLEERSTQGAFRLDLYHRLAVFPVDVPALAERMEDLPALAEHFLSKFSHPYGRKSLTPDAVEELLSHGWPGNVRELMHVIERATILSGEAPTIERTHVRLRRRPRA